MKSGVKAESAQVLPCRSPDRLIDEKGRRAAGMIHGVVCVGRVGVRGDIRDGNSVFSILGNLRYPGHRHYSPGIRQTDAVCSAGKWVLCDRFADSTLAYQGYGQGLDLAWLWTLRRHIVGATEPGLTIMLDLPVERGLARAATEQRYERMGLDFHRRLTEGFRQLAAADPDRCRVIDAAEDRAVVASEIRGLINARFGLSPHLP